jgi:hypothetical protein
MCVRLGPECRVQIYFALISVYPCVDDYYRKYRNAPLSVVLHCGYLVDNMDASLSELRG